MEKQKQSSDHRKLLLEWETPEFEPIHRGPIWYLVGAILIALLVLYAAMTGSLSMALVFILIAVLFVLVENREPRAMKVRITDMGLDYGGEFYPYHQINAFWMVYHPPFVKSLYLRIRKGKVLHLLKIELHDMNPVEARKILLKEIPEIEGAEEPLVDTLFRILRLQ